MLGQLNFQLNFLKGYDIFNGTIVGVRENTKETKIYRVKYDDDDIEDITHQELEELTLSLPS